MLPESILEEKPRPQVIEGTFDQSCSENPMLIMIAYV